MTRFTVTFFIDADLDAGPFTGPEFRRDLRDGLAAVVATAASGSNTPGRIVPGSVRLDTSENLTVLDRLASREVVDALRLVADIYAATGNTGRSQRPEHYRGLADRLANGNAFVSAT
jgi:hypothetical protein